MAFEPQLRRDDDTKTRALRVLIVRVGAMGDVLHGLPAVAALRACLPDCFIGWTVEPGWKNLLVGAEGGPIVDRVHLASTKKWKQSPLAWETLKEIAALRREMQGERYDVCVDLQGTIKSAVIGRMAGAKHFLGPIEAREGTARLLYGKRTATQAAHVIEQACELVAAGLREALGGVGELRPARVTLPGDQTTERWCEKTLKELGVGERGFVLLAPTAGWGAKQWPVERYRALSARLNGAGYKVLVNGGGRGDLAVTAAIAESGPALRVECDLAQLIALTRRAELVVGGDTGPVHLAAALGRPVVGLYGPTDPRRNGPHFPGSRCRVLRHAESRSDHKRRRGTEAGLAQIDVGEVEVAAFDLLRETAADD